MLFLLQSKRQPAHCASREAHRRESTMTRVLSAITAISISTFANGFVCVTETLATTLYAGVSHTDSMMHVDEVRTGAANPIPAKSFSTVKQIPQPAHQTPPAATRLSAPPLTGSATTNSAPRASAPAPAPVIAPPSQALVNEIAKASAPQTLKQGYIPAFGVAHVASNIREYQVGNQKYSVEWFMIPAFMPGIWQKEGDLTVEVTNLHTGAKSYPNQWIDNKLTAKWGHQMDAAGNVWQINLLPYERDGLSDGKLVRFLTVSQRCEQVSQAQLVTRTHYLVSESDTMRGAPEETFQQESINDYVLEQPTQMVVNKSSNRVFNYAGKPVRDGHLVSKYRKIANFTPIPTLMGLDLRQSLRDFLISGQLSNLVPK